jgi:tRNA U55 pseudouridine synthase TruB
MKNGILVIDKPSGVTSHDVVDMVRRKLIPNAWGTAGRWIPLPQVSL